MGVGVDSLAEQGFEVQLKAAYRRVEGVQLSAFLPGAPHPVRAVGPRDRKSTRLNSSHAKESRMPSSA